jgi:hypothetical protein
VLPVIAFAVVEEWYGPIGGVIAGALFGAGELIYEYLRDESAPWLLSLCAQTRSQNRNRRSYKRGGRKP